MIACGQAWSRRVAADNLYSQIVALLKVMLPLGALALLSTLFLYSSKPRGESEIPFAEIEAIAREPRIALPNFTGMSEDGSVISISALSARPIEGDGGFLISGPNAKIDAADGTHIEISAGEGMIDTIQRITRLDGLTRIVTSSGYEMETSGLTASFNSGRIESHGALEVRAPFGSLTAGQLIIETPEGGDGQRMLFNEGVRLIYTPQQ
ncbi:MAG: lipopolysaccharide export system protein LptC [Paracoccaceae bacterium]|jgi:lipopolysaccharide export system protein LptC